MGRHRPPREQPGQDLTVIPGRGTQPQEAGFSLQFPTKDKTSGRSTFTALPALAYDPPLPSTLPVGGRWEGTFAGAGELPHDGTMISVGFGLFTSPLAPQPSTLVTNTSFTLH